MRHVLIIHGLKIIVDSIWEKFRLDAIPGGHIPCLVLLSCSEVLSPHTYSLFPIFTVHTMCLAAFELPRCFVLTCGWKSGGDGLRNFSFRAPTGSSSFLFSTLLDQ